MTLEIHKLLTHIDQAAAGMAEERATYQKLAGEAQQRLDEYGEKLDRLHAQVEQARAILGGLWRGARPTDEPINSAFDPPADLPPVQHVVAADGSQIFPDRHGLAHYALVNVGVFHLQPGSGRAPEQITYPDLLYGQRMRDDEQAEALQAADVSRERDKQELEKLVDAAVAQEGPTVALMDSPLALWMLQPDPEKNLFEWFIRQLWRANRAAVLLAGYVDRPGSRGVADLLALAPLTAEEISKKSEKLHEFRDMPDRAFFYHRLAPGQRSALFISDSPFNRKHLQPANAEFEIAFFYLNVGRPGDPAMARVETPCWVAQDRTRLGQLHRAIWEQCQAPGRYPYALARAHEIAVVDMVHRRELEALLAAAMLSRGLEPRISDKSALKGLTGG